MKKEKTESNRNSDLRRQAEERLKDCGSDLASSRGEGKDSRALVHELQVHQVELEMQNEELKRAKLETEDALSKYSDLYDFAPIGLFAFDSQGQIQEVNLAGAKLLGVERRSLMNRHFQLFVAPNNRPIFDDLLKSAFETSLKQTSELKLLRDGEPAVYARIEGTATEDGSLNGRQLRIAAIDITERRKAESILERYQLISKYARDIILLMGRDGHIIEANEAAISAYGYSHDELRSKNISDLRSSETLEIMSKQMQLADSDGLLFETKHRRKDGSTFPVEVSSLGTVIEGERVLLSIIRDITDRKQMEVALKESEVKFRTVADNTYDWELWLGPDGKFIYCSPSCERITGHCADEFLADSNLLRSIIYPNDLKIFEHHFYEGRREEPFEHELEFRIVRHDGAVRWVGHTCQPVFDGGGRFLGTRSSNRDITERKQAEEALRQSEQRYRNLFESMDEGFALCEMIYDEAGKPADFRYLNVNPAFARLTGLTVEQVTGRTVRELIPGIEPIWIETYGRVVQSGLSERIDNPVAALGRHYEVYAWRSDIGRFAVVFSDITQRKRMEKELRETQTYLENLINYANAPIIVWDPSFRITRFNHAFERLTGHRESEVIGEPLSILFPENSQEESLDHINSTLSGEHWDSVEIPILRVDGSVRTVLWNSANIYDKEGTTVVSTIAQGQDITERKLMEYDLHKARDELEQRVKERTADLSDAKIELESMNEVLQVEIEEHKNTEKDHLKAKEAAEAATKAKAAFLANMSHEIRTPMNSIIGFTELLLDDPLTPEQRDNLETIRINGDALLTIINDILDFSKIESDKVVLEEYQFNLRQCVEEALDLVAIKASEKGLNLAYEMDKEVPDTIIVDPSRLRQILGNLLSNAVKFTDEGEVTLSVSSQKNNDVQEIHFAVQDTGIGIPPDHMKLLFQSFSQMEPSTTRLYGGTGLGLAISKKLVELMGGRIWAESEVGKGSTFHFTIKASSSQSEPQTAVVSPQMLGKSVLIVSDNKTTRRILGKQAYDWGMIPLAVASGREALKYIRRGDGLDIAILDMDLQDINGFELEEQTRKYNKTLPLVLLTSIGQRVPPNHAYLTKPIKPSQLHKVMIDLLSPMQPTQKAAQAYVVSRLNQISPLSILLAEDNVSSQKVFLQMLKKLGYKADTVANGIEVLQALERQHYDVVFMDIRMPEMDGLEATRIIRQKWPNTGLKVIALTAYALEGDREKCLAAGMDDYISKPVRMEELGRVLKEIDRL